MLERFFIKPQTVDRILSCWLGSKIEHYVTALHERGYSARTVLRRVPVLTDFAVFAASRGVDQLEQAEALVDAFVADWLDARRADRPADARRRDRNFVRAAVRHFFSWAAETDYHRDTPSIANPFATQAPGFFDFLVEERGLRLSSIRHYRRYLREFEVYLEGIGCRDIGTISMPVITGYITTMAQKVGSRSMVNLASSLRAFLRYAHREGVVQRDLTKLIELPQHYRLADIPRSIGWDSVQKMLDQVDHRTVVGRRDYAVLLLMVMYGLRSREVAALTLDDIDWNRSRLHVRERKADHTTAYPLAPAVGEAIISYLKNGRPEVDSRAIFWRYLAPRTALTAAAVSSMASKYFTQRWHSCCPARLSHVEARLCPETGRQWLSTQDDRRLCRSSLAVFDDDLCEDPSGCAA